LAANEEDGDRDVDIEDVGGMKALQMEFAQYTGLGVARSRIINLYLLQKSLLSHGAISIGTSLRQHLNGLRA
jgi:hypothetical protein